MCQGRAAAHDRLAVGRFDDPTARSLLREDERVPVEQVRSATPPKGWSERSEYEMVRASAEVIVPRTVAIDDAVRLAAFPQLVILGAGVWEGVVPYLTPADVEATVGVVRDRSAPGSRLIVNYQSPSLTAVVGRLFARAMSAAARRPSPLAGEPRRSSWKPEAMGGLLASHGWRVTSDDDLATIAGRLGMDVRNRRSLQDGRVAIAETGP